MTTALKPFHVTIRRFNPTLGPPDPGAEEFVLPVDSPDEDHAIASTLANAASFTTKYSQGQVVPVAFLCTGISPRS